MKNLPKTAGMLALLAACNDPTPLPESDRYSVWQTSIRRGHGATDADDIDLLVRKNLFCTTGNGYNWLAQLMGQGCSFLTSANAGTSTSATSSTIVNSGAPFTAHAFKGCVVVACTTYLGGALVWGVVLDNTTTTITVDQWYSATSSSGAVGTQPAAGGSTPYCVLPFGASAQWLALSSTVITPDITDTTLSGELTVDGFNRAAGTYTFVATASTFTQYHLWTCVTAGQTINSEAMFNANYNASLGYMPFENTMPTPPSLLPGDTIAETITVTL